MNRVITVLFVATFACFLLSDQVGAASVSKRNPAWEPVLQTLSPPRGPPYRGKCPRPLGLAICAPWPTDSCHSDRDCGGELKKCCQGDCSKYCLTVWP